MTGVLTLANEHCEGCIKYVRCCSSAMWDDDVPIDEGVEHVTVERRNSEIGLG